MAGRGSIRFVPGAARQVLDWGVKQHAQSTLGITIPSVAKTTSCSFGKPLTAGVKICRVLLWLHGRITRMP